MKKLILLAPLAIVILLNSGCSYTTKIISIPPGARIEVDDDYIGDAPISVEFRGKAERRFDEPHTVRALPINPGQEVQTKLFNYDAPIPKTILFDMNLTITPEKYQLDIKNR